MSQLRFYILVILHVACGFSRVGLLLEKHPYLLLWCEENIAVQRGRDSDRRHRLESGLNVDTYLINYRHASPPSLSTPVALK